MATEGKGESPYQQGSAAFWKWVDGEPLHEPIPENPYQGLLEAVDWQRGWDDADDWFNHCQYESDES